MTSSFIDRLALIATSIIFCVAIFVLFGEFASVSRRDVLACLVALPKIRIFAAVGVCTENLNSHIAVMKPAKDQA